MWVHLLATWVWSGSGEGSARIREYMTSLDIQATDDGIRIPSGRLPWLSCLHRSFASSKLYCFVTKADWNAMLRNVMLVRSLTVFRNRLKTRLLNCSFPKSPLLSTQWLCHFGYDSRSFYLLTMCIFVCMRAFGIERRFGVAKASVTWFLTLSSTTSRSTSCTALWLTMTWCKLLSDSCLRRVVIIIVSSVVRHVRIISFVRQFLPTGWFSLWFCLPYSYVACVSSGMSGCRWCYQDAWFRAEKNAIFCWKIF